MTGGGTAHFFTLGDIPSFFSLPTSFFYCGGQTIDSFYPIFFLPWGKTIVCSPTHFFTLGADYRLSPPPTFSYSGGQTIVCLHPSSPTTFWKFITYNICWMCLIFVFPKTKNYAFWQIFVLVYIISVTLSEFFFSQFRVEYMILRHFTSVEIYLPVQHIVLKIPPGKRMSRA